MKSKKMRIILIIFLLGLLFLLGMTEKVNAADSDGNFVIVLDPGHGGGDPGATGGNIREDQVNFKIAYYAKQELEQYEGIKVYLTRYNNNPSIYDRVEIAKSYNADLLVSMHINAGGSTGAAVWVTQDKTKVQYYEKAGELGNKILNQIKKIGVKNNGVQTRSGKADEWYSSGVVQDYYGIIRYAQRVEMRSILVEHCYIDRASDREFINSDDKIKKIAHADVMGIVEAYQLKKKGQGYVPVKLLTLDKKVLNLEIQEGDLQPVAYFNAIFSPNNASNTEIDWYSSDSSVVRVWNNKIRGLKEGNAVITAISKSNQRISTCRVSVTKPAIALNSIYMNKEQKVLNINEKDHINIRFNPSDCTDKTLYWTSSSPEIVRVWDGDIRGLQEGESTITATSRAGGKKVSCKVVVKDSNKIYVDKIIPEKEEYTIGLNEAIDINYSYSPANATNTDFSWTSSNSGVLRVYWNRVRGLKEGTSYIIVKTPDELVEKRIKINVIDKSKIKVQQIIPEKEEYTIGLNEVIDINYSYSPTNATNTDFSWTASNFGVLRVYWNRIRGLKEGTSYIVVKTPDGSVEKRIKINVIDKSKIKVQQIIPEKEEYTIGLNEVIDINYSYSPTNATNIDFSWTASNSEVLRVYWNRVRGLKKGTSYIIIKTPDGSVEKRIKIVVK